MDPRFLRKDFSQLAPTPSSNFKPAGSASQRASKPHKARGIAEVSNRNTISKDSTQKDELRACELRNRDTISKDLTQSNGPFKSEMQNRGATSKEKIESGKARRTAAAPPKSATKPYYLHGIPSPQIPVIQQQQVFQQQQQQAMPAQQFQNTVASNGAKEIPMGRQLSPAQLRQLRRRNAAARSNPGADYNHPAVIYQQMTLSQYVAQQQAEHQRAAMGRT